MSLAWDTTINEQLKNLAAVSYWDPGRQKRMYIFPAAELNKIIALIGKEFNFEEQKVEIFNILQHAPGLKEEIGLGRWKGEGYTHVQEFPKLFIISTIIRKKAQTFKIPIETVEAAWKAIKTLEKGKSKSSKDLAEKWCKEMGITRFHRQTGSWDGDKMYGDRDFYFKFYYSLKVLQHYGLIEYTKAGMVSKLKDLWEFQGKIL